MVFKKIITTFILIIATISLSISFQNCSSAHEEQVITKESVVNAAKIVINNNCVQCHSPTSNIETGIDDLLDVAALKQLTINGLPVWVDGQPTQSQLYLTLIDEIPPHDELLLTPGDLDVIAAWIAGLEEVPTPKVQYYQVGAIIEGSCTACHPGNNRNVNTYTDLMTRSGSFNGKTYKYVTPGDPENSLLYIRVTQSLTNKPLMPQGQPALSPEKIKIIYDWIKDGALNQ